MAGASCSPHDIAGLVDERRGVGAGLSTGYSAGLKNKSVALLSTGRRLGVRRVYVAELGGGGAALPVVSRGTSRGWTGTLLSGLRRGMITAPTS